MAPRKQTKQAADSVAAADANGDVTPPKKRKIAAAAKAIPEEAKQVRSGLRRAKAETNKKQTVTEEANPAKKSRPARVRNTAMSPKVSTKSKTTRKVNKAEEMTEKDDARAQLLDQVVEKKATRAKNGTLAKKAGTKEQVATKVKTKALPAKKRKSDTSEKDTGRKDTAVQPPAKKTTRAKAAEKEAPAARTVAAKAPLRKRRNLEDAAEATRIAEAGVAEEKEAVPDKKPRSRAKKAQGDDEPKAKPKGKAKKNIAKAEIIKQSSEDIETKEQNGHNTVAREDDPITRNTRNAKRGNVKKAVVKGKHNIAVEKMDDIPAEDTALEDIKENGQTETLQTIQSEQKKRNTGKTNITAEEKTEAKGKQKKGKTAADEEEATNDAGAENDDPTEKTDLETFNESDVKDALLSNNISMEEEEKQVDKIKCVESIKLSTSNDDEADISTANDEN